MGLTIIVTNAGRAALVNATNTGTDPVTIAQVGLSATALVPSPTATTLPGEFKRLATLSGDVVADDTIHMIVRDEGLDVFTVRSLALYLADGTLFAIYGQADVLVEKSSQSMLLLAIDVKFEDVDAAALTFGDANFLNPPATTEQQGVVELATTAEAQAGIDALRALTPATAKAAILGWLLSQDGAGSGLDADLLDGQDSSYFTNIIARLGYTPANKAGDTFGSDVWITKSGNAVLGLNSSGVVIGKMVAQSDGNVVFYTNRGVGDAAIWSIMAQAGPFLFNVPVSIQGGTAWHAGNDGAGSGLDADLLDGQQGSYYLAVAAYTAADVLAKLLTVDGAGSGLDADLLDGQQGSYYTDIAARLGYTPARGSGQLGNVDLNTATNSGMFRFDVPTNGPSSVSYGQLLVMHGASDTITQIIGDYTTGTLWTRSGNPANVGGGGAWGAWKALVSASAGSTYSAADVLAKLLTVDGSGSGLDADTLDGQDSSYFTNIVARLGFTPANKAGDTFSGWTGAPIFAVGDDALLRDVNIINTIRVEGQQNADRAYFVFGNADNTALGRTGSGALTYGGNTLWHAGNDGAGSGLDADLLDGLNSSYFTDIIARLGFTPVNKAGDTMGGLLTAPVNESQSVATRANNATAIEVKGNGTGPAIMTFHRPNQHAFFFGLDTDNKLKIGGWSLGAAAYELWHAGNDGAGSGLDADLLDGQQGSYYLAAAAYTAADVLAKLLTVDGAGSGLDADTLDGFQAADLLRVLAESQASSGYMKLSNGLLLQWGRWTSSASAGAAVTVTFPIAFSAEPFALVTMPVVTSSSSTSTWSSDGISGTSFPARCSQASIGCRYIAIGAA